MGRTWATEFKEFLLRGNLVDLAVAIVIGVAFAALVNAFVADLITPILAAIGGGDTAWRPGALERYDDAVRSSFVWKDLRAVRNMRPAFAKGLWRGGMAAGMQTATMGNVPRGDARLERDSEQSIIHTNRAARYPAPDGTLTFDKLSSVYASGNRTRDDQPNHIRIERRVPLELAELWTRMCPAQVYEVGGSDGDGTVEVQVTPSNCIQCGAITAKGGRLTPPEGGSGPEYTLT